MRKIKLKNVMISAFFGALGPYFNKQTSMTMDQNRWVVRQFMSWGKPWLLIPFDVVCFILMLWANTISVKYKMLSYKYDGAFIGTTLIFVLGYVFSSGFDYLYEQQILPAQRICGAVLIIVGVMLISMQEKENKVKKHTQSIYEVVGGMPEGTEGTEETDPSSPVQPSRKLPVKVVGEDEESKEECLIDKTKLPPIHHLSKSVPNVEAIQEPLIQPEENTTRESRSKQSSKSVASARGLDEPSRLKPDEMGATDYFHMRKGYL